MRAVRRKKEETKRKTGSVRGKDRPGTQRNRR